MPSNTLEFRRAPRADGESESAESVDAASSDAALPRHIAIIMDGNGRWARRNAMPRIAGHRRGLEAVKRIAPIVAQRGIPYLTLFAFSSENWRRPSAEVALLLDLLEGAIERESRVLHDHRIRLRVIGDLSRFSAKLQRSVADAVELTRANAALHLTVAINYGGRWDIAQACRAVAALVERGELPASAVTPAMIESHLCTRGLPEPDLFIRTGGEQRVSNFLLWQLAYTELHFTDAHWPDFDRAELERALAVFARRQRRFGKTAEQIAAERIEALRA